MSFSLGLPRDQVNLELIDAIREELRMTLREECREYLPELSRGERFVYSMVEDAMLFYCLVLGETPPPFWLADALQIPKDMVTRIRNNIFEIWTVFHTREQRRLLRDWMRRVQYCPYELQSTIRAFVERGYTVPAIVLARIHKTTAKQVNILTWKIKKSLEDITKASY